MRPKINNMELKHVIKLPAAKRYSYFIKKVADWEVVWGLYSSGWALNETDEGRKVFPIWPAKEFADYCATGVWEGYVAEEIELTSLMEELLPKLKNDCIEIGVFFVPDIGSVDITIDNFIKDLNLETEKYT